MNQSVMAGDPAHQELLKRKTLFKGGQRTQEESTTIAVISKDFKKKQNMNNIRVLAGPGDPTAPVLPAARMPDRATHPRGPRGSQRAAATAREARGEGGRGGAVGGGRIMYKTLVIFMVRT